MWLAQCNFVVDRHPIVLGCIAEYEDHDMLDVGLVGWLPAHTGLVVQGQPECLWKDTLLIAQLNSFVFGDSFVVVGVVV